MNLSDAILRILADHADRPFLIDSGTQRIVTYREFGLAVAGMAIRLRRSGVQPGHRVGVLLKNCPEYVALYFACLCCNVVIVPINRQLPADGARQVLELSRASFLIVDSSAEQLVEQMRRPEHTAVLLALPGLDDCIREANGAPPDFQSVRRDELFSITYTSGTTGTPKGVSHTAASLFEAAVSFNAHVGLCRNHRFLHVLNMAYMAGLLNTLLCPFMAGGSVVLCPPFHARTVLDFWRPIREHDVTALWMVPTMLAMLLQADRQPDGPRVCRKQIDRLCVGTAPLPTRIGREFEEKYGARILESYGLSELLFVSSCVPSPESVLGTVGAPLPGVLVKIAEADGEILVRTPFLMREYFDSSSAQPVPVPRDAWFPTGDIGRLSEDGNLMITDRKKDLIVRGGANVSPRAIEALLETHEEVEEVAVVGMPHDIYGEEIVAAVKPRGGQPHHALRAELATWCGRKSSLPSDSLPSRFVFLDEIPKTATGKTRKPAVIERIKEIRE